MSANGRDEAVRPLHPFGSKSETFFGVQVEQIPEKKGVVFKHVEYEIICKGERAIRRYNDFVVFHDALLQCYPTRLLPRLPPKKAVGADEDFIAKRKRALTRYMSLLARHPVIGKAALFLCFVTHRGTYRRPRFARKNKCEALFDRRQMEMSNGLKRAIIGPEQESARVRSAFTSELIREKDEISNYNLCVVHVTDHVQFAYRLRQEDQSANLMDVQTVVKSQFRAESEEFLLMPAEEYNNISCSEWNDRLAQLRDHMTILDNSILKMRKTMEMICSSSKDQGRNYMALNLDISNLCSSPTLSTMTTVGAPAVLSEHSTRVLMDIASEVASVTKQWLDLATTEESTVAEYVYTMKDLMKGSKDLFLRQSKTAAIDQKAVNRAGTSMKPGVEKADERTAGITTAENRVKFSLYCIQQETGFVQSILPPLMSLFLGHMANVEHSHLLKIAHAWEDVAYIAEYLPAPQSNTSSH